MLLLPTCDLPPTPLPLPTCRRCRPADLPLTPTRTATPQRAIARRTAPAQGPSSPHRGRAAVTARTLACVQLPVRRPEARIRPAPEALLDALLADLRAEQADLQLLVHAGTLDTATPATGWDVRDAVSHLMGSDREATKALTRPELFLAELPQVAEDVEGFLGGQLEIGRALDADALLDQWHGTFGELLQALAGLEPSTRVPWYGPSMSPVSFATARLMEYWAHGQDVADGLGVTRTPTARLRHVCDLGVRTFGFAHVLHRLPVPAAVPRVTLVAPDGETWQWGSGSDAVEGPAVDFALRVTQRRHRDQTALIARGPLAEAWLDIAQCFAGPPGPGRPRPADPP